MCKISRESVGGLGRAEGARPHVDSPLIPCSLWRDSNGEVAWSRPAPQPHLAFVWGGVFTLKENLQGTNTYAIWTSKWLGLVSDPRESPYLRVWAPLLLPQVFKHSCNCAIHSVPPVTCTQNWIPQNWITNASTPSKESPNGGASTSKVRARCLQLCSAAVWAPSSATAQPFLPPLHIRRLDYL